MIVIIGISVLLVSLLATIDGHSLQAVWKGCGVVISECVSEWTSEASCISDLEFRKAQLNYVQHFQACVGGASREIICLRISDHTWLVTETDMRQFGGSKSVVLRFDHQH